MLVFDLRQICHGRALILSQYWVSTYRRRATIGNSKHGAYRPQKPYGLLGTGYGGMEVGGEGDYIPVATLSLPELLLH